MTAPPPLIAGNWKMHGTAASLGEARAVAARVGTGGVRVAICPPATLVQRVSEALAGSAVLVGGPDCHLEEGGALTRDASAQMLVDARATLAVLRHSERR